LTKNGYDSESLKDGIYSYRFSDKWIFEHRISHFLFLEKRNTKFIYLL
jgi:hypothetical protein